MKKLISLLLALTVLTALPVFAADVFTPSAEQKDAPAIVEIKNADGAVLTDENGKPYAAVGRTKDGEMIADTYILASDLIITALSDLEKDVPADLSEADKKNLEANLEKTADAFEAMDAAEDITTVFGKDTLDAEADNTVTMLFDMTFVRNGAKIVEKIFAADGLVEVTLPIQLVKNANVAIATLCEDEWVFVDAENITDNKNGTYTILFEEFCPVAIIQSVPAPDATLMERFVEWVRENFFMLVGMMENDQ